MIDYNDCNCNEGISINDDHCELCDYWYNYNFDNTDYSLVDDSEDNQLVKEFEEFINDYE